MFSRFATALYNAVDVLSPPLPLQEEFEWHWKAVTKYYTSQNVSNKTPIEETNIPGHLMEMLTILEQEQQELEPGNIGPCMEYIMHHKLLDTMHVLSNSDTPPGMKRYMIIFVTRMLKATQQFLIPHVSFYVPINKFIALCGETPASPTEKEEMDFLDAICDKLQENEDLINCFISPITTLSPRNSVDGSVETSSPNKSTSACSLVTETSEEYSLISSLLKLFSSPDNCISLRASDCVKKICSFTNDTAAMTIVKSPDLGKTVCCNAGNLYKCLSKQMKLSDIEDPVEDDIDEVNLCAKRQISGDRRKVLCYLQYLTFVDTLIEEAHPLIAEYLTEAFRMNFLDADLYEDLVTNQNKDHNLFVTVILSTSLRNISSCKLMYAFSVFLLGGLDNFEFSGRPSHIVKDLLIERCRNAKDNVALSMASLQLFEELLQRPSAFIMHNLIINYLENRRYFDHTVEDGWQNFSDSFDSYSNDGDFLNTSVSSSTFAPPYISNILDTFLSLVPAEIKSCDDEDESGYDTYVKEAQGRYIKCLQQCEEFDWPTEPLIREESHLAEDDESTDSQPEADSARWHFYEGPFLNMLLDKVEHMLEQPYDINLQVTAIVSRLALFAHPNLHEYLLNPLLPLSSGTRSLFTVLTKVIEMVYSDIKQVKSFKKNLQLTRSILLSDNNECEPFEGLNTFEVLIVIEEFCKELAAITFVKYHEAT